MKPSTACENPSRRILILTFLVCSAALFSAEAYAKSTINSDFGGLAIGGYDPVAYFTVDRAVEGSEEFTHEYLGSEWRFTSAAHRDMFKEDPLRYLPQYGGYCASAVPQGGGNSMINPRVWRMVDGRLYLFYSETQRIGWSADDPEVADADAAWDRVKAGLK